MDTVQGVPAYDVIIAGAGIVGLATAWAVMERMPGVRIAVVEKEWGPAVHQSGRNSGVLHSGIYYKPGSLKAELCLRGYGQMVAFADAHNIPYRICGKLIAATTYAELPALRKIFERGLEHGLDGLALLDTAACRDAEPHVSAVSAILVPQGGIIDFAEVARKLARKITDAGGVLYYNHRVEALREESASVRVSTLHGDFEGSVFVNCCGLYADEIAMLAGVRTSYRILPFRGEFYALTEACRRRFEHLVYPVPDPRLPFLGVHFTPQLDGGVEVGPSAVLAFRREGYTSRAVHAGELLQMLGYSGFYRMAWQFRSKGLAELWRSVSTAAFLRAAQKLVPGLQVGDLRRSRTGVRAQCVASDGALVDDFVIAGQERMIHLINAPSPAATAAFAIGEVVARKVEARMKL